MSSSLLPGDKILVNKIKTGSRFPNTIFSLPGDERSYIDALRIPYFRIPGFRKFRNDDVVVFNDPRSSDIPLDKSKLIISRVAGVPGDTLIILDKELFINRDKVQDRKKYRRLYRVVTDGSPIPPEFVSEYKLEQAIMISDIGMYDLNLDSLALEAIQELSVVKNVRLRRQFFGDSSKAYFPYSSFFNWNRDQFGALIVPFKGFEAVLSIKNIDLYRDIIDIYEGNDLIVDFSGVTINGKKADTYIFKYNYYIVLDDNRDNPNDTRIIGFIPESHLLGTSKRILFSGKSGFEQLKKSGISRFFKKID